MFDFDTESGHIRAYGEIGGYIEDGISDTDFMDAFDNMGGRDVTLTIHSPGGDVFEGLSIVNQVLSYSGDVYVVIDSLAASIASVIASAGNHVSIHENSMGNAREFRGLADFLDKIGSEIAAIYSRRTGRSPEEMLSLMADDTYLNAEECFEMGFVDAIISGDPKKKTEQRATVAACAFPTRAAASIKLKKTYLTNPAGQVG